jgi:hypothetical protein
MIWPSKRNMIMVSKPDMTNADFSIIWNIWGISGYK